MNKIILIIYSRLLSYQFYLLMQIFYSFIFIIFPQLGHRYEIYLFPASSVQPSASTVIVDPHEHFIFFTFFLIFLLIFFKICACFCISIHIFFFDLTISFLTEPAIATSIHFFHLLISLRCHYRQGKSSYRCRYNNNSLPFQLIYRSLRIECRLLFLFLYNKYTFLPFSFPPWLFFERDVSWLIQLKKTLLYVIIQATSFR